MIYRNNAGRLGSGFISVCLETRWLGQKSGFYVPERPCTTRPKRMNFWFYLISLIFSLHIALFIFSIWIIIILLTYLCFIYCFVFILILFIFPCLLCYFYLFILAGDFTGHLLRSRCTRGLQYPKQSDKRLTGSSASIFLSFFLRFRIPFNHCTNQMASTLLTT